MATKKCKKCGNLYPETREFFGSTPKGYLRGTCRKCMCNHSKAYDALNPARESKRGANAANKHIQHLRKLLIKQNYCCAYCNKGISIDYEVDHITPISRGGLDTAGNLQLLCPQCNREKHNKTHVEHVKWRSKVGIDNT